MTSSSLSSRIWFLTSVTFGIGYAVVVGYNQDYYMVPFGLVAMGVSAVASLPALVALLILFPFIKRRKTHYISKWLLVLFLLLLTCLPYGIIAGGFNIFEYSEFKFKRSLETCVSVTGALFVCNVIAVAFSYNQINSWIKKSALLPAKKRYPSLAILTTENISSISNPSFSHLKTDTDMTRDESFSNEAGNSITTEQSGSGYNKTLIKGLITAGLILAMLIPAAYITNLAQEREQRHKQVIQEVSSKWASAQTITTPYLCIPYLKSGVNDTGKPVLIRKTLFIPANTLDVKADIKPELRKRSIYNVFLYKSNMNVSGNIVVKPGNDVKPENILFDEARLCIGFSDLKGIEEKITAKFNGQLADMEPAIPDNAIDKQGLSVPVTITAALLSQPLAFTMNIKIKGSEQLHFLPLSDNSNFEIVSPWRSPSFDGSSLPKDRVINDSGFTARWSFNKANMPVLSQLLNTNTDKESMAFGVTMVQPADQYAKTNRSVKYAILFVGLTFAMFFIIELMQKKNVHPVQYVLIGLALIIFYTLLLSISEFTGFNIAYAIAGSATVILIGIYAGSLFASIKTSLVLSTFIGLLYGFIYVLIQLEDTALLAGSIGLFGLLAVAMYFSKRINWYGSNNTQQILTT